MMMTLLLLFSFGCGLTTAFTTTTSVSSARTISDRYPYILCSSTTQDGEQTVASDNCKSIDPKDAVRVFGRLAEKYIMLDESGGMCCYSACKDCEYRLPDGGYRMADQRSSRPKWIPVYEERVFAGQNKEHIAKWKTGIFGDGENSRPSVSKEEFVSALINLEYVPPLGGPFVAASGGTLEDTTVAEHLFDLLSNGKEKLSRHKMSLQLKQMADGEQGLTWPSFQSALGL
ncbi:hypothetical protein IV203_004506 [Nitzschia inconspicua]|uniref:Uncharacterized protein n=1 Tax=Nitzschia inconspicua TaxID=303405 RepID=A0A9K3PPB6_9STRA|nr:hypothetical protein IV203_004506 [Nitzschia inconspicua]